MTAKQEAINLVFETWKSSQFSSADEARIERTYGREVLHEVQRIHSDLCGIGMTPQGMDESMAELETTLAEKYSWLSESARGILSHSMMMCWK